MFMIKGAVKILLLLGLIWPLSGQAALFYFEDKQNSAVVGQDTSITLKIDTQGQLINAIEGDVLLPSDLQLVDIFDNGSIISFWVEKPENKNNIVHFSGITPGGFMGQGILFKILVKAGSSGSRQITLGNLSAYLSDGQGTNVIVSSQSAQMDFIISEEAPAIEIKINDNERPEDFTPIISRLDQIEPGIYFLIFATQDKGSGIDYYEVREGWYNYQLALSPYRLKNQELNQDIFVKAVDKAGNERVVKVLALYDKAWYENFWFYVIMISVVISLFLGKKIKLLRHHGRSTNKNKS